MNCFTERLNVPTVVTLLDILFLLWGAAKTQEPATHLICDLKGGKWTVRKAQMKWIS
jgi:hypothetical protein